jgi:hypothetical protein
MDYFDTIPNEILYHVFSFVPFYKNNWKNILLTCKRFVTIGEQAFDPALANNRAIRYASSEGQIRVLYVYHEKLIIPR